MGNEIKEDEVGGARRTQGGDEKCVQKSWLGSLKGEDHLEDLGVDERIILSLY
jgi:hypothetical protein